LIPEDSDTPVIYNAVTYDTAEMFPGTFSGDSRFTATVAGLYLVRASVLWTTNQTGERRLRIRKNGGFLEYSEEINPGIGHPTLHVLSGVVKLDVEDYVEAVVHQTSGGPLAVRLALGTDFEMHWMAPIPA
jgi:hypothetical protein